MGNYFVGLLDEIDASVYTGDAIHDPDNLAMFKEFIDRWQRAITEHEQRMDEENN